jgi:hypothetical protein
MCNYHLVVEKKNLRVIAMCNYHLTVEKKNTNKNVEWQLNID